MTLQVDVMCDVKDGHGVTLFYPKLSMKLQNIKTYI